MGEIFNLPDGTRAEIPDNMSMDEFQSIIARQFPPGTPVTAPQAQEPAPQAEQGGARGGFSSVFREGVGLVDTAAVLGSGIASEVISGIGGLAKSITSGSEAGQETQEQISQAIIQDPRSEKGERNVRVLGEVLSPVIKGLEATRAFLGDTALAVTGSPGIATAFSILPDVALEVLGAKGILAAGKGKNLGKISAEAKKLRAKETLAVNKGEIIKAAPKPQEILDFSSNIYKEVDSFGARVKPEVYGKFADDMAELRTQLDIELNPEISRLLDIIDDGRGKSLTVSQMDNIRKKTVTALQKSSKSGVDKFAAAKIQRSIDDLLGDVDSLNVPEGIKPSDVSLRLNTARKLWSRGKRAQLIDETIKKASEADNPHQALKTAFIKLLKDDVTKKQFTGAQKQVLRDFTKPGSKVNILKIAANFGLDIDRPRSLGNVLALGLGGGTAAGVNLLAGGTAIIGGTIAQSTVKKLLNTRADFANAIFAAGPDASKIIKVYFKEVPKGKRSPSDLAGLLIDAPQKFLDKLPKTDFIEKAKFIVESRRRAGALSVPTLAIGLESERAQAQ